MEKSKDELISDIVELMTKIRNKITTIKGKILKLEISLVPKEDGVKS